MLNGLVNSASRLLGTINWSVFRDGVVNPQPTPVAPAQPHQHLHHITLTDEVDRTLFREFAAHRDGDRGEEEIGWVLLGVREADHALALATLPAGAQRSAGVAHVQFNSTAQGLASRIVRQWDKRLTILGVVHTHPGHLRRPSEGDLEGDREWVGQLRGREGVFAIGTADVPQPVQPLIGQQPQANVQTLGEMCFSWYSLRAGEDRYRPLEMRLTLGPDLAAPLRNVWSTIEHFAEPLERLCRQLSGITFAVLEGQSGPALALGVQLFAPESSLRVVLEETSAQYVLQRGQELLSVDPPASQIDKSVYLMLAELTGQS
jgi:proteasome lid subunit RPN8/RPN11